MGVPVTGQLQEKDGYNCNKPVAAEGAFKFNIVVQKTVVSLRRRTRPQEASNKS